MGDPPDETKMCAFEYTVDNCPLSDESGGVRPGDRCGLPRDEGCQYCEEHCDNWDCKVHHGEAPSA